MSPQSRSALARAEHHTTVRHRPARPQSRPRPVARRVSGPAPRRAHTRVHEGTLVGNVLRSGVLRVLPGRTVAATAVPAPVLPRRTGATGVRRSLSGAGVARVRTISGAGFLDTLLRSRAWIWLIGVLLGGIVAMQVSLLKLNTGIGRAVTTVSTLERANAGLEAQIARLSSGERIQATALEAGLVMPDAGAIGYLTVREGDARRAAARMQAPSERAQTVMATGGIAPAAVAPVMTAPPVTEPAPPVTEPAATEPAATEPAATDPAATTAAPATTAPAPAAPTGEG